MVDDSLQRSFHLEGRHPSTTIAASPREPAGALSRFLRRSGRPNSGKNGAPQTSGPMPAEEQVTDIPLWKRKTTHSGLFFSLAGLALAGTAIHMAAYQQREDLTVLRFATDFMMFLATTFFSVGIVSFILDMKGWKEYFEMGLMRIVLRSEFLKKLNSGALKTYQVDVFKRVYDKDDIDQEGRFLRYCLDHIHDYIVQPYREEIRQILKLKPVSPDCLEVLETLRYICRAGRGGIQEHIKWETNKETIDVQDISFELYPPKKKGGRKPVVLNRDAITKNPPNPDGTISYEYKLDEYRQDDRLEVAIHVRYTVDAAKFCTWRMAFPSRCVDILIMHPPQFEIQFIPFLLDHQPDYVKINADSYSATFDSWIMPMSGFAWRLYPADNTQAGVPSRSQEVLPGPTPLPAG
jgi:hypothetical protein